MVYRRGGRGVDSGATHKSRRPILLFAAGDPDGADLALCSAFYRQAKGLIGSIISLLGLTLRVPDHTTLSRRSATLAVPRPQPHSTSAGGEARPLICWWTAPA
jgi:hypothetical protein